MPVVWATSLGIVGKYTIPQSIVPRFSGFAKANSKLWIREERSGSPRREKLWAKYKMGKMWWIKWTYCVKYKKQENTILNFFSVPTNLTVSAFKVFYNKMLWKKESEGWVQEDCLSTISRVFWVEKYAPKQCYAMISNYPFIKDFEHLRWLQNSRQSAWNCQKWIWVTKEIGNEAVWLKIIRLFTLDICILYNHSITIVRHLFLAVLLKYWAEQRKLQAELVRLTE